MPGRKRSPENQWLPPKVTKDKHGFRYRNRKTKELIRLKDAAGNTLKHDADKSTVWAAYESLTKEKTFTLSHLVDRYMQSPAFTSRATVTQRDYITYANNVKYTFGDMIPETITAAHVRLHLDTRGKDHPVAANHEKAFLSLVFNWGLERNLVHPATPNPCATVKNLTIKKVNRYIEDHNYYAFFNYLIARGNIAHAVAMAIAYNCAARQQDVLSLLEHRPFTPSINDSYLTDEHIFIIQAKTGRAQNKTMNAELKQVVRIAKEYKRGIKAVTGPELLVTPSGTGYTRDGFNVTWLRRQKSALEEGVITKRFRFHDLKHKGISDHTGNKKDFSGHATDTMVQRYDHSVPTVTSLKRAKKKE